MPTGYTAAVQSGQITTLRDFALLCARAMGATIMMRDEPLGAPIPERFEPSSYYAKQKAEAEERLAALQAMTEEQYEEEARRIYHRGCVERDQRHFEMIEQVGRYNAMLAKVEAWETPAEGIRKFMIDQLRESIRHDSYTEAAPVLLTGAQWFARAKARAESDIAYYAEQHDQEVERTEGRNKWLADLRASLPEDASE